MTTLVGTSGNDTFSGLSANADPTDVVDTITGGTGSDVYRLAPEYSFFHFPSEQIRFDLPLIPDVVTDFQSGAGGDAIDISGLLNGLPAYPYYLFDVGLGPFGTNPFVAGILRLFQSGPDTHLQIDV